MFCGGLATAFANTTSVESDFSILKWEMNEFRTCMMHLSLEGIFQAKQRQILEAFDGLKVYNSKTSNKTLLFDHRKAHAQVRGD